VVRPNDTVPISRWAIAIALAEVAGHPNGTSPLARWLLGNPCGRMSLKVRNRQSLELGV